MAMVTLAHPLNGDGIVFRIVIYTFEKRALVEVGGATPKLSERDASGIRNQYTVT